MSAKHAAWKTQYLLDNNVQASICVAPGTRSNAAGKRHWSGKHVFMPMLSMNDIVD